MFGDLSILMFGSWIKYLLKHSWTAAQTFFCAGPAQIGITILFSFTVWSDHILKCEKSMHENLFHWDNVVFLKEIGLL